MKKNPSFYGGVSKGALRWEAASLYRTKARGAGGRVGVTWEVTKKPAGIANVHGLLYRKNQYMQQIYRLI